MCVLPREDEFPQLFASSPKHLRVFLFIYFPKVDLAYQKHAFCKAAMKFVYYILYICIM